MRSNSTAPGRAAAGLARRTAHDRRFRANVHDGARRQDQPHGWGHSFGRRHSLYDLRNQTRAQ